MNNIPWFSTFTLLTETIVTASILYIFYSAYFKNEFKFRLVSLTIGYEVLFNISYMAYRALTHIDSAARPDSAFHIALAAFHGIFSLLMFVLLLVFMLLAWRNYKQGINYFREHRKIVLVFLISWLIAVLSGYVFYYEAYFSPEEVQITHSGAVSVALPNR